jgi:hypothetical protein
MEFSLARAIALAPCRQSEAFGSAICLLMALPLAMLLGMIGVLLGRSLARTFDRGARAALPLVLVLLFLGLVAFDDATCASGAASLCGDERGRSGAD